MLTSLQNIQHYQAINLQIDVHDQNTQDCFNQLQYYEQNLHAIRFYFATLKRKVLKSLQLFKGQCEQRNIAERFFIIWRQATKMSKLQKYLNQIKLFSQLKANRMRRLNKNIEVVQEMSAQNCYEKCLKVKLFFQWKQTTKIIKKQKILNKILKLKAISDLIKWYQIRKSNKFTLDLIDNISRQTKIQKSFKAWIQYTKQNKVNKRICKIKFIDFVKKFKKYCKHEKETYNKFYQNKVLKNVFLKIKANWQNQKYTLHSNRKVLRYFFNFWIKAVNILYYEKEEEIKNQQIVQQYQQRKAKVMLLYLFQKWKNISSDRKEERKKIIIAKEYGLVKQKHFWLERCFNSWKDLKKMNKAEKHYQKRVKGRVVNILKDEVIKGSSKWENLYKFVEKRQKRKYFDAMKTFIIEDQNKVDRFCMGKYWNKFTFGVAMIFSRNTKRAQNYHIQSLKFKTIYGLKLLVSLKAKTQKVFIFVNIKMKLKRWQKGHKIKQFVEERKYVVKGIVFRALKLGRIGKLWSERSSISPETEKKRVNYGSRQNKTQISLELGKMGEESPSKLFSLDYSISAYNSNHIFQNI